MLWKFFEPLPRIQGQFGTIDAEHGNYDVKGSDLEGEPLTVRVAFSQLRTKLILVTGF